MSFKQKQTGKYCIKITLQRVIYSFSLIFCLADDESFFITKSRADIRNAHMVQLFQEQFHASRSENAIP